MAPPSQTSLTSCAETATNNQVPSRTAGLSKNPAQPGVSPRADLVPNGLGGAAQVNSGDDRVDQPGHAGYDENVGQVQQRLYYGATTLHRGTRFRSSELEFEVTRPGG